MKGRTIQGVFEREEDLLRAAVSAKQAGWEIVDIYTPYAVHEAFRVLGLAPSRLPRAAFVFGLLGVGVALWFQSLVSGWDWGWPWNLLQLNLLPASDLRPLNVGGRPWNSWPAFVPVAFEMMVLCAGLGVVLSWLVVCRMFPGKSPALSAPRVTDDAFVLEVREPRMNSDSEVIQRLFRECHVSTVLSTES
jgi:Protein of unknown function (DUF3341)